MKKESSRKERELVWIYYCALAPASLSRVTYNATPLTWTI